MGFMELYNQFFGSSVKAVRITKEQRAEIEEIESKAYVKKAKALAEKKGEAMAQNKFDEMMKQ